MSRRTQRKKRKSKPFMLAAWLVLFLDWLFNLLPIPAALNMECSDDEDLVEPPSWAVISDKLQAQTDQVLALTEDVEKFPFQTQENNTELSGGAMDLDRLEADLIENKARQQALQALTERYDDVMQKLSDEQALPLNVSNQL